MRKEFMFLEGAVNPEALCPPRHYILYLTDVKPLFFTSKYEPESPSSILLFWKSEDQTPE